MKAAIVMRNRIPRSRPPRDPSEARLILMNDRAASVAERTFPVDDRGVPPVAEELEVGSTGSLTRRE